MSNSEKGPGLYSIATTILTKYNYYIFFAAAVVLALFASGINVSYKELSLDGQQVNSKLLTLMSCASGLIGLLTMTLPSLRRWKKKPHKVNSDAKAQGLLGIFGDAISQASEYSPDTTVRPLKNKATVDRVIEQRRIAKSLSAWLDSSREKEKWVAQVVHEMSSSDTGYHKYIEDQQTLFKSEINQLLDTIQTSLSNSQRPQSSIEKYSTSTHVYIEALNRLERKIAESLKSTDEFNWAPDRSKNFILQFFKELKDEI